MIVAAERLFAERGIEGVSLREIGRVAGQRFKSAPQYYFGDRDGLVLAILEHRQEGLDGRRRAMLDDLEREDRLHDVRALVEVVVRPLADAIGTDQAPYLGFLAMVNRYQGRHLVSAPDRPYTAAANRAVDLLREAMGDVPAGEAYNRFALLETLLLHGLADCDRLVAESPLPESERTSRYVDAIIDTITAVLMGGRPSEGTPDPHPTTARPTGRAVTVATADARPAPHQAARRPG
jgi:AcrR family transcriptional regulator